MSRIARTTWLPVAVLAIVLVATSEGVASYAANCTPYLVIDSRGSGELEGAISPPGSKFFQEFQRLHPSGAHTTVGVVTNPYPAAGIWSFAGAALQLPGPYHSSVVQGKNWLSGEISTISRTCPDTKMLLTGYSQGAQVTADVYQNGSQRNVLGVALFGDPYFNSRDSVDGGSYERGLDGGLGTRRLFTPSERPHVLSYCHQHDPVCQSPYSFAEFGIYRFSRHNNYDKLDEPEQAARYFTALVGPLQSVRNARATTRYGPFTRTAPDFSNCLTVWAKDTYSEYVTITVSSDTATFTLDDFGIFVTTTSRSPATCRPATVARGLRGTLHSSETWVMRGARYDHSKQFNPNCWWCQFTGESWATPVGQASYDAGLNGHFDQHYVKRAVNNKWQFRILSSSGDILGSDPG